MGWMRQTERVGNSVEGDAKGDGFTITSISTSYRSSSSSSIHTDAAAPATMDDYFFQDYVRACRNVTEATSYLEIFNYSVSVAVAVEVAGPAGRRCGGKGGDDGDADLEGRTRPTTRSRSTP